MADKAFDGLPYGQFGTAIYNADEHEWSFGRQTSSQTHVGPIGTSNAIADAAIGAHTPSFGSGSKDVPSRRREKQTKALVQALPDLQPAAAILPDLARISEAVEEAASRHDSATGQLVAIGKVYDERRRGYSDAIAFPAGPTGSDLRIIQGLKQRQGWNDDERTIQPLSFAGEEAVWEGPGVSLLSVLFAEPLEIGEHYLAVRLPTQVLIFRPVLRKHTPDQHSRLDPNHIFSISIDDTGGVPHADVAFNPWFTGQLAIVDQAGSYSVWETGRKSRYAKRIKSGRVSVDEEEKPEESLSDRWARICWAESSSTLCIATRHELRLLSLESAHDTVPQAVDIGLQKDFEWVLGFSLLHKLTSHLFVLTSSRITVYLIGRSSDKEINCTAVLQLRHHRNPEDVGMCMSLAEDRDKILLVLRSAFSPTVDHYCLDFSNPEQPRIQQPRSFELPCTLSPSEILDDQFEAVPYVDTDVELQEHHDTRSFWNFYLLRKDFSLSQTLYASIEQNGLKSRAEAPSWTKQISKPPKDKRAALLGLFDDDEEDINVPPMSDYVRRRLARSLSRSGKEWTISHELVARKSNDMTCGDPVDVDEIIEEISTLVRAGKDGLPRPMHSLVELANSTVAVGDFEGASERLEGLQRIQVKREAIEEAQEGPLDKLVVSPIASPAALGILDLGELNTLSRAMETLSTSCCVHSENVFRRSTLEARKHRLQRLAAELVLASQVIRTITTQPEDVPATQSQSQSQEWELPVRPTPFSLDPSQDAKPSSQRLQSPALPTPSASASTITGSSYPLGISAPEVASVSKYTTFSKEAPSALPRALNKVLAHWTLGADPAEYDWRNTTRQVSQRDQEMEEDGMTEKERRQMQRRTERYIRRQRREAEESQRMQFLSSQAPEIVTASQPGLAKAESQVIAGAGSSQNYGLSQMAASQVVPGRHGGRPPLKKKRKSGF